jgi:hypothetical protein
MTELEGFLERVVAMLDAAKIPFMVAGSFASATHGLPRTTQALDLVIDPATVEAIDTLVGSMPADDYYVDPRTAREAFRHRTMFNVIDHASGWKVDFIIRKNRDFSREEFARRQTASILGVPMYVASPEDTIVSKLEWSRMSGGSERQRRDIAGVVATLRDQLDRTYIERWVHELDLSDEWQQAQRTDI